MDSGSVINRQPIGEVSAIAHSLEVQVELGLISSRTEALLSELMELSHTQLVGNPISVAQNLHLAQRVRFAQSRYDEVITLGRQAIEALADSASASSRMISEIYKSQMAAAAELDLTVDALAYAKLAVQHARIGDVDEAYELSLLDAARPLRAEFEADWRTQPTSTRANRWLSCTRHWFELDPRDVTRDEHIAALVTVADALSSASPRRPKLYARAVTLLGDVDRPELSKSDRKLLTRCALTGGRAYIAVKQPANTVRILDRACVRFVHLEWADEHSLRAWFVLFPLRALRSYARLLSR